MNTGIIVNVTINTAKLADAERKVGELAECIKKAKSLADDLARDGLNVSLEIDV